MVDANGRNPGALLLQRAEQLRVRFAVFLNRNAALGPAGDGGQQFAQVFGSGTATVTGTRISRRAAAGRPRARDHGELAQRRGKRIRRVARSQHFVERARTCLR